MFVSASANYGIEALISDDLRCLQRSTNGLSEASNDGEITAEICFSHKGIPLGKFINISLGLDPGELGHSTSKVSSNNVFDFGTELIYFALF